MVKSLSASGILVELAKDNKMFLIAQKRVDLQATFHLAH